MNKDNPKNEYNLKNEDGLKNEDNSRLLWMFLNWILKINIFQN